MEHEFEACNESSTETVCSYDSAEQCTLSLTKDSSGGAFSLEYFFLQMIW